MGCLQTLKNKHYTKLHLNLTKKIYIKNHNIHTKSVKWLKIIKKNLENLKNCITLSSFGFGI